MSEEEFTCAVHDVEPGGLTFDSLSQLLERDEEDVSTVHTDCGARRNRNVIGLHHFLHKHTPSILERNLLQCLGSLGDFGLHLPVLTISFVI